MILIKQFCSIISGLGNTMLTKTKKSEEKQYYRPIHIF